jgi:flagellar motor switch protein FliN/FliY
LIDSQIMQLLPVSFAKELVQNLLKAGEKDEPLISAEPRPIAPEPPQKQTGKKPPEAEQRPDFSMQPQQEQPQQYAYQQMPYMSPPPPPPPPQRPINVQPAQFQSFDSGIQPYEAQNIGLLMDVPLQITVELGRTTKKIKEILEFGQGSIIELDKLAGEPVDILVNGKNVAKGEVVVIDESFGVRITDIIHPSKRL